MKKNILLLLLVFSIPTYAVEHTLKKSDPNYKIIKRELIQNSKSYEDFKKQLNIKSDVITQSDKDNLSTLNTKDLK